MNTQTYTTLCEQTHLLKTFPAHFQNLALGKNNQGWVMQIFSRRKLKIIILHIYFSSWNEKVKLPVSHIHPSELIIPWDPSSQSQDPSEKKKKKRNEIFYFLFNFSSLKRTLLLKNSHTYSIFLWNNLQSTPW